MKNKLNYEDIMKEENKNLIFTGDIQKTIDNILKYVDLSTISIKDLRCLYCSLFNESYCRDWWAEEYTEEDRINIIKALKTKKKAKTDYLEFDII